MTASLDSILRTRAIAVASEFPYVIMFPRDLNESDVSQINDWLESNCIGKFSVRNIRTHYSFRFANNDDFMLFMMRWYDGSG